MAKIYCTTCKKDVKMKKGWKMCPFCGSPIASDIKTKCEACESEFKNDLTYCPKCGMAAVSPPDILTQGGLYRLLFTKEVGGKLAKAFPVRQGRRILLLNTNGEVKNGGFGTYNLLQETGIGGEIIIYDTGEFHVNVEIGKFDREPTDDDLDWMFGADEEAKEDKREKSKPLQIKHSWISSEGIEGKAKLELVLKIESPEKLRVNLARDQEHLNNDYIGKELEGELWQIIRSEFQNRSIYDLMGDNIEFKDELRNKLRDSMRGTLMNNGLVIERIASMDLQSPWFKYKIQNEKAQMALEAGCVEIEEQGMETEKREMELEFEKDTHRQNVDQRRVLQEHQLEAQRLQSAEALDQVKHDLEVPQKQRERERLFAQQKFHHQREAEEAAFKRKMDAEDADHSLEIATKEKDAERETKMNDMELDKKRVEVEKLQRQAQIDTLKQLEEIQEQRRKKAQEDKYKQSQLDMEKMKMLLESDASTEQMLTAGLVTNPELKDAFAAAMQAKGNQQHLLMQQHYHQQMSQQQAEFMQHQQETMENTVRNIGTLAGKTLAGGNEPRLIPESTQQVACPHCSKQVQSHFPKCPYCGNDLK